MQALAKDPPHLLHGKKFFALVRAGYHLCRIESLKEMLQSVLDDTLTVFNAQRGAALLRDDASGQFTVQACVPAPRPGNAGYSLTLTERLRDLPGRTIAFIGDGNNVATSLAQAALLLGINVRLVTLKKEAATNARGLQKEVASTQRLVNNSVKSIERFAREFGIQKKT